MKKKPLIAIDFAFFDHSNIGAGQYRYVVQIARGLVSKTDFRYAIIGSQPEPVPELREMISQSDDWEYYSLPHHSYPLNDLTYHLRYSFLLKRIGARLFHATHVFVPALSPCPVVMTKHDLMEELFDEYQSVLTHRPYKMHKWATKNKVAKVISISQCTHDDLIKYFQIDPDKSVIIHHGIQHGQPTSEPEIFSQPEWIPYKQGIKPWILAPYNLEPRKNLIGLVRALPEVLKSFPELKLVLFGKAALTPERVAEYDGTVNELGVEGIIQKVGFVSDEELTWLYANCRIFIFPTFYEGFGYPIIEAMSAGASVISAKTSSMAELMSDIGIGVDVKNANELAHAIIQLLNNPDHSQELKDRGQKWAREFTLDKVLEKTYATYLSAINT